MTEAVRMLRLPEVLDRRGCSKAKHYQDIARGEFPQPLKLGPKVSVWPETDVIDEQRRMLAAREARTEEERKSFIPAGSKRATHAALEARRAKLAARAAREQQTASLEVD